MSRAAHTLLALLFLAAAGGAFLLGYVAGCGAGYQHAIRAHNRTIYTGLAQPPAPEPTASRNANHMLYNP